MTSQNSLKILIIFSVLILSCDACKNAFRLADLVVSEVEQFTSNENNEDVYEIIHKVVNSIQDISCPDEVADAESHDNNIPIEYSSDGNFETNGSIVASKTVEIGELPKNLSYQMSSEIIFAVDGAYRIIANLDINDDVEERNENNNSQINPITGNNSSASANKSVIIYVKNTGLKKPKIDKDGNPIYLKKWTLTVQK